MKTEHISEHWCQKYVGVGGGEVFNSIAQQRCNRFSWDEVHLACGPMAEKDKQFFSFAANLTLVFLKEKQIIYAYEWTYPPTPGYCVLPGALSEYTLLKNKRFLPSSFDFSVKGTRTENTQLGLILRNCPTFEHCKYSIRVQAASDPLIEAKDRRLRKANKDETGEPYSAFIARSA